jgi:hypothetical protein
MSAVDVINSPLAYEFRSPEICGVAMGKLLLIEAYYCMSHEMSQKYDKMWCLFGSATIEEMEYIRQEQRDHVAVISIHFQILYLEAALFHPDQHTFASDNRWGGACSLRSHFPYVVPWKVKFKTPELASVI